LPVVLFLAFEKGGALKEEEFARAVSLGLFDYLRKSRSKGFTISLSGGADSCACTALCGLMIRLADESIGLKRFKEKLSYIKEIQSAKTEDDVALALIHNIYQGTENSSEDTLESARSLALSIGSTFYNININGLVETYKGLIEEQIGRKLSWEIDDIALQNIQARVRAPGVWLLTNLSNHLLLATSNRSEVAVGYATMDGDTSGSISPLAGIDKHYLRQWLRWLETVGCEVKGKHIRIEGLHKVNALQPTAELRPLALNQTDEADLMPYDFLDALEKVAIRDKKSPVVCYKHMLVKYNGTYSDIQILGWTERFFRLWSRNQWKRERYAPSFHLDDLNLDPRSWCRFPILSGGFEKELEELREYAGGNGGRNSRGRIGF
jgi:NAD+ synthase (glutamine-hydrolysing)